MTALVVTCSTCEGRRYVKRPGTSIRDTCPDCGGIGNVRATAAHDAMVHDVLGPIVGQKGAEASLAAMETNRSLVFDWLCEARMLGRTQFGLVERRGHDGWGHPTPGELVPEKVGAEFGGRWLYVVWP